MEKSIKCCKSLLPHQVLVSRYMINHDRILVYHTLGSGKTYSAIAAARYNNLLKSVVICYSKLVSANFRTEVNEFRSLFPYTTPNFTFLMYMSLNRRTEEDIKATLRGSFIIIDEAHTIREGEGSSNFRKILKILKDLWNEKSIKLMLLTGTPIVDSRRDLKDLMSLMNVEDNYEDYISYMNQEVRELDYMGETTEDLKWETINLELPESYSQDYITCLRNPSKMSSFYTNLEDVVLASHVKQDKIIENIRTSMSKSNKSRFFIYCNRLGENGINYLNDKVIEELNVVPVIITGKESRNFDIERISDSRIIIGSLASNEGINIQNLTEVHVVTSHWNISQINQVIGRGTRFTVDKQKKGNLKVYRYIVYRKIPKAIPEFSIDLYKYKKSYDKNEENRIILGRFSKLIPKNHYIDEVQIIDIYEDLRKIGCVSKSGLKEEELDSIRSLCLYNNVPLKENEFLMELVNNEEVVRASRGWIEKYIPVRTDKDVIFSRLCNMEFKELLEELERSVIEKDFETTVFFRNSIVIFKGIIYHTFAYREPSDRFYSMTYLFPKPQGISRKLKMLSSGDLEWLNCSREEERKFWDILKKSLEIFTDPVELLFSLSERKFKIKINSSNKIRDKRKSPRGKDVSSYRTQELIDILRFVAEYQLFCVYNKSVKFPTKDSVILTLIRMFYDSHMLKFV